MKILALTFALSLRLTPFRKTRKLSQIKTRIRFTI